MDKKQTKEDLLATIIREEIRIAVREEIRKLSKDEVNKLVKKELVIEAEERKEKNVMQEIIKVLKKLGVSANLEGYEYVKEAVILVVGQPEYKHSIVKNVYLVLGEKFGKKYTSIERGIRTVIEKAWAKENAKYMHEIFGNVGSGKNGRPTNAEFISLIADIIQSQ